MSATVGCYEVATTQQDSISNLALEDSIWFKILAYTDSATVARVRALSDEMRGVVDRLPDDYVTQINVNNPQDKVGFYQKMILFAYDGTDGRHVDAGYVYSLLSNPNTSGAILSQIMGITDCQDALVALARHLNTTNITLDELSKHELVREAVAMHPNLSRASYKLLLSKGLQNFLDNRNCSLLAALASNTSAPPDFLKAVSNSFLHVNRERTGLSLKSEGKGVENSPNILAAVASNSSTPLDRLQFMWRKVGQHYEKPGHFKHLGGAEFVIDLWGNKDLYLRIANNPKWPYEVDLFRGSAFVDWRWAPCLPFEQAEASNWHAPPQRLKKLATHSDVAVRRAVASNQNTPPKTLRVLALYDPDSLVRQNALVNPNLMQGRGCAYFNG